MGGETANNSQSSQLAPRSAEAIRYLEQQILSGKHWYMALLEAMGLWTEAEETIGERTYRYLIAGEAFDWLLLAERLCEAVDGLLPENEKLTLLFHGKPPLELPPDQFKEVIGDVKYHQHLNYFYGVTVEEALIQAVQEEVRKEKWSSGFTKVDDYTAEVYRRIYGTTRVVLLKHFRKEKGYPQAPSISMSELKEFTYWLFKYRIAQSEKCKVASDTRKGLDWLKNNLSRHSRA